MINQTDGLSTVWQVGEVVDQLGDQAKVMQEALLHQKVGPYLCTIWNNLRWHSRD